MAKAAVDRNNFTFLGLTESTITEDPDYMTVFEFEKQDFVPVHNWIVSNFSLLFYISGGYLASVYVIHAWMKNREPFHLRKPLFVWNIMLSLMSLVMVIRFLPELFYNYEKFGFYRSYCKLDHLNSATVFWLTAYSFSKVLEFMDTMFILLRKNQLTFLHVFHHTSVFICCFCGLVRGDPAARVFALMNAFVHFIMYGYYATKAAQIKLPRKIAMAVTSTQLLQFGTAIVINILVVYAKVTGTQPACERPNDITALYFTMSTVYFGLFGNFFVENYFIKPRAVKAEKST